MKKLTLRQYLDLTSLPAYTVDQIKEEYLRGNKAGICFVHSTPDFQKFIRVSRIGASFTCPRAARPNLYNQVSLWRSDLKKAPVSAAGAYYENEILKQQERRDYYL